MMDEMSIRKFTEYSNGKYHGFVDIGAGVFDDSSPLAKNALVVLAVSLTEGWKIPIGYFLIDGMTGGERANLTRESFQRLHDAGVTAVSLTCDGPPSNFAMLSALGVDTSVDNTDPSFPHPADTAVSVSVFLDVCHMMKLLRGAFSKDVMKTEDGRLIKWDYIKYLNNLQEKEGLRLGNNLRSAHILWRKQKMNVKLAAQVFSSGVADALQYCNETLKLPEFEGCEATVEFIRHVDFPFDVLNSRNPL